MERLYAFPGQMFESVGMIFPVATVEVRNSNFGNGFRIQTANIDADPVRVRARDVKGFDAAVDAETVLRDPGVEGVGGEILLALEEAEPAGGDDQVEVGGLGADRTVTELGIELGGGIDLETNPTAVTTAGVSREFRNFGHREIF